MNGINVQNKLSDVFGLHKIEKLKRLELAFCEDNFLDSVKAVCNHFSDERQLTRGNLDMEHCEMIDLERLAVLADFQERFEFMPCPEFGEFSFDEYAVPFMATELLKSLV